MRYWSPDEDAHLRSLRRRYDSVAEVAARMPGRSANACRQHARLLGIGFSAPAYRPRWAAYMDDLLRHYWNVEGLSACQCAKKLGVSRNAVIGRAHRMALDKRASPIIRRGNVLQMPARGCEYGLGDPTDPGFKFCGKPRQRGSSYCAAHHKLCYRRVPAKKDSPQPFMFMRPGNV
jgi:GcrA cell cycle regulator